MWVRNGDGRRRLRLSSRFLPPHCSPFTLSIFCFYLSPRVTGYILRNGSNNLPVVVKEQTKAPDGEGCPRCGVYVYAAEQMLGREKVYHRRCFKCLICNHTLDSTTHCDGPDREIYCRRCYAQKFGARGYGHIGVSSLGLMSDIKDLEWQGSVETPHSRHKVH